METGYLGRLEKLAEPLQGKNILTINSTRNGGGVAELLHSLVPTFNDSGISTEWLELKIDDAGKQATKAFHNALQGENIKDIRDKKGVYLDFYKNRFQGVNQNIVQALDNLDSSHIVINHDPQTLYLVNDRKDDGSRWLWRCHIDIADPDRYLWRFIRDLIAKYDAAVVSHDLFKFGRGINWHTIHPSIDPLTDKNRDLEQEEIDQILQKYNIPMDLPIITQVGRLDKWKDPVGLIEAYRLVRKKHDCRLALVYNGADDDPEGDWMLERVLAARDGHYKDDILLIQGIDPLLVNVMQTISYLVAQKSLREGFALVVSEALWKETPVVAVHVGGIPLQIINGYNGFLVNGYEYGDNGRKRKEHIEAFANRLIYLLDKPDMAKQMGKNGRELVRENFITPIHVYNWLNLLHSMYEN